MHGQPVGAASRGPLLALFVANAISQLGNMVSSVAIPWFVLETTGSAAQSGLTTAVTTLPLVVVSLVGGSLADRVGAKRMSVVSDVLSALTTALIPLLYALGMLSYPLLLVVAFLGAILDPPGATVRQTLLPELISRAGVAPERANAIYQAIFRASILLGPPLGGLLISTIGATNALWFNAATFVVSAVVIAAFVPRGQPQQAEQEPVGSMLAELTMGIRFVLRDRLLRWLLLIFALVDLLANALLLVVVPVYAAWTYGSSVVFGSLLSSFGGGMLAGTLLFGAFGPRLSRRASISGGLLLSGLPVLLLLLAPPLPLALVIFALMGFGLGPGATLAMGLFQERTPPELRGRVFGARTTVQLAALPLGVLVTGVMLEQLGLLPVIAVLGVPYAALGLLSLAVPLAERTNSGDTPPANVAGLKAG